MAKRSTKKTSPDEETKTSLNIGIEDPPLQSLVIALPKAWNRSSKNSEIEPDLFHGSEDSDNFYDVQSWLEHYEKTAELNGWNNIIKALRLRLYLRGPAKIWFRGLKYDIQDDWDEIKKKL